jgi:hypothetical protein
MNATTRKKLGIGAGLGALASLLWIASVDADGIPAAGALSYVGTLEEADGTPLSGSKEVRVALFDAVSGGAVQCTTTQTVALTEGRFQIVLPDACTAAARGRPDLWVEVAVDGDALGRSKLSAVPYAVESARASAATGALASQIVPAGAVMAFDLGACPNGWSPLAEAAGRVVVGAGPGLARGATPGEDFVTLSVAQMPSHGHGVNDPGHAHNVNNTINYNIPPTFGGGGQGIGQATIASGVSGTGISIQETGGGQRFDNRQASLALLYCKKN